MTRSRTAQALVAVVTTLLGATGGSAAGQEATTEAPAISPAQVEALVQRARQSGPVDSVEVAGGTAERAQTLLDPAAVGSPAPAAGAAAVDVVVVHGRFTYALAKVPRGMAPPSGTMMAFTVDRRSHAVAAVYVGDSTPALASMGRVERLAVAPAAGASDARRRASRIVARRHRRARAATWGSNCSYTSHCYVLGEWLMSGGERVEGTESEQKTTAMNVPGWQSGYFVTNEEWSIYTGQERWTEIGQQAGEYKGCCNLWWFYAFSTGPHHYSQYVGAPYVWEVTANTWNNYGMQSTGNGVWCFDVGPHWEQRVACAGGFDTYSEDLADGVEVATAAKPANAGSVVVNATFLDGLAHTWKRAEYESTTPGLCWSHYAPVNFPGNINYGTC